VAALVFAVAVMAAPGRSAAVPGPQPPTATLVSASTAGDVLSLVIDCHGGSPGDVCSGGIALTTHVRANVIAVTAAERPPETTFVEIVAGGAYAVRSGLAATVPVTLNTTGQALLGRFVRLPASLTLTGTLTTTRRVVFGYARIASPVSFTWTFTASFTTVQALTVTRVPSGGKVQVICHGGGCPFLARGFSPTGGRVALAAAFRHSRLRPHTTVELEITAPNSVGKVVTFVVNAGAEPSLVEKCLPPGAPGPTGCG
jgi:hypothetical protein